MRFLSTVILYFLLAAFGLSSFAQGKDSLRIAVPALREWMKFDGAIKTKLEVSADSGVMRFNVRN